MAVQFRKDLQYYRFCFYGFFKNLRFFEAFLVLFFLEKGMSFIAIGSLYAAREITVNIFEVPSGVVADAWGRRRTMILAFLFYIVSFLVFFVAEGFGLFMLAMIVFSLGEAFRSGNNKAMIFHYLREHGWEDQKVHYYGHTRSWSQLGSALSALSGAAIVFYSGSFKYIFLFSTIPYIIDLFLVASYPSYLDGNTRKVGWQEMTGNFRKVFRALWEALRSGVVLKVIGSLSVHSGYYKAIKDYLQAVVAGWAVAITLFPSLDNEQRSSLLVGLVFFGVYLFSSMASRYSGRIADLFSSLSAPLNISLFFGLACGVLSGFMYINELWGLSVVLFVMVYMNENIRKPVGVSYLGNSVDRKVTASVLSADSQAKSLVAALLALLFGIFADLFGLGWSIFGISAGLLLLSPLLILNDKKN